MNCANAHVYISGGGKNPCPWEEDSTRAGRWPQNCLVIIYLFIKGTGHRFRPFPGAVIKTPGDCLGKNRWNHEQSDNLAVSLKTEL